MHGDIKFLQCAEVVPRKTKNDPIRDTAFVFLEDSILYGMAVRVSGDVDIYWNLKRINEWKGGDFIKIKMNFQGYHLLNSVG